MQHDFDWKTAGTAIRRALELAPGNAMSLRGACRLAAIMGRFDDAIALGRQIVALDPLSLAAHRGMA